MTDFHSPGDTAPAIQLQPALARLDGDETLLRDLAEFYLEDAPVLIHQIEDALAAADADTVCRAAHSLKGLSANFDAHRATAAAFAVETTAKKGDLDSARQNWRPLQDGVKEVMEALKIQVLR